MNAKLTEAIAALAKMRGPVLRARYAELFGDGTGAWATERGWCVHRLATTGPQAEGGLSERARRRATELANEADLRLNLPAAPMAAPGHGDRADPRLPVLGESLTRPYKGRNLQVTVREHGFEYEVAPTRP